MTTSRVALVLGLVAVLLMPAAGMAYRAGLVPLSAALLPGMGGAALLGTAAMITGAYAAWRGAAPALAVAGIVLGLVAVWLPATWIQRARSVPPIHDITTDIADPPTFQAVVPLRANAPNTLDYDPKAGEQQRQAYADVAPAAIAQPPAQVFERALAAAREAGWEIVSSDPQAGRIEATDTTFWFGFKDDVVVRLTPDGSGTRVDVRSVSRVGRSDVGTNARRIRDYLAALGAS